MLCQAPPALVASFSPSSFQGSGGHTGQYTCWVGAHHGRAGADPYARFDRQTLTDNGSGPDMATLTDANIAAYHCAGRDVAECANLCVMLDHSTRIDDRRLANLRLTLHHATRQQLCVGLNGGKPGHHGTGMLDARKLPTSGLPQQLNALAFGNASLGADTTDVLSRWLGLGNHEIESLIANGVCQ